MATSSWVSVTSSATKPNIKSVLNPPLEQIYKACPQVIPGIGYKEPGIPMNIYIIGAGGTGGYVIRDLARFVYSVVLRDPEAANIKITIVDPDIVEEKNVLRQNFMPGDVGKHKAEVMAKRHSMAFGIEIGYYNCTFGEMSSNIPSSNVVIIGCVDNNKARREIHTHLRNSYFDSKVWIDSGNERKSGQVILGNKNKVPTVTGLFPEILDEAQDSKSEISCAERMLQDEQNIFVNVTAANLILNFVRKLALREPILMHGTAFNIDNKFDNYFLLDDNL